MQTQALIEILVLEGDPKGSELLEDARAIAASQDIRAEISTVEVCDSSDAEVLGFAGSPSIRIDGCDLEVPAPRTVHFGPRTYFDPDPQPRPPRWMIEAALVGTTYKSTARWIFIESGRARWSPLAAAIARAWTDAAACANDPFKDTEIDAAGRAVGLPLSAVPTTQPDALSTLPEGSFGLVALGSEPSNHPLANNACAVLHWDIEASLGTGGTPRERANLGRDLLQRRLRVLLGSDPRANTPFGGLKPRDAAPVRLSGQQNQLGTPRWRRMARNYAQAQLDLIALAATPAARTAQRLRRESALKQRSQKLVEASKNQPRRLPMAQIAARFELTLVEQEILWLALALSWSRELWLLAGGPMMAQSQEMTGLLMAQLLGLSAMEMAPWLEEDAPLRRHGLLVPRPTTPEPEDSISLPLALPGHVMAFLTGRRALSRATASAAELVWPRYTASAIALGDVYKAQITPLLAGFWRTEPNDLHQDPGGLAMPRGRTMALRGDTGSGRVFALKAVAGMFQRRVLLLDGERAATSGEGVLSRAFEEAALFGELLIVREADALVASALLRRLIARHRVATVLCLLPNTKIGPRLQHMISLDATASGHGDEPAPIWMENLTEAARMLPPEDLTTLMRTATLKPVQVRNALDLGTLTHTALPPEHQSKNTAMMAYTAAIKAQAHRGSSALLNADLSRSSLDDLVLPPDTMQKIHEILAAVSNRHRVLHQWRLRERLKKGLSITCLFDGDPGTGKTLTAEVLASELGLRLMRVNISTVVDKYIGETEKNLESIFKYVRSDLHLLLFDEADSLFAKRSQKMERSTDRYSNMDINVLLQLIEQFDGIAVLTTNLKKSIDPAFERRISFKVHFPIPGEEERLQIWRNLLPEEHIPTSEEIDFRYLASVELSGGEIKNAVLRAAYRAAHAKSSFDTDMIMDSALAEARASGRLVRQY